MVRFIVNTADESAVPVATSRRAVSLAAVADGPGKAVVTIGTGCGRRGFPAEGVLEGLVKGEEGEEEVGDAGTFMLMEFLLRDVLATTRERAIGLLTRQRSVARWRTP